MDLEDAMNVEDLKSDYNAAMEQIRSLQIRCQRLESDLNAAIKDRDEHAARYVEADARLCKVLNERCEQQPRAEKAEAFASVRGGEWCAQNRAEGRGGCGACAWCCKQANERAETSDAAGRALGDNFTRVLRECVELKAERDEARRQVEAVRERVRDVVSSCAFDCTEESHCGTCGAILRALAVPSTE